MNHTFALRLKAVLVVCLVLACIGLAMPAMAAPQSGLRAGANGHDVVVLQMRLYELGFYPYTVTGQYGVLTQRCVTAFQKANNLTQDGIAGPKTLQVLYSNQAVPFGGAAQQP